MSNIIEFTLPAIEDLEGLEIVEIHVVVATLNTLAEDGQIAADVVDKAIKKYKINTDAIAPVKG